MKIGASILVLSAVLAIGTIGSFIKTGQVFSQTPQIIEIVDLSNASEGINTIAPTGDLDTSKPAERTLSTARYRINPGQSRFMAHASASGLLWFLGHGHHIAVRDFMGEAALTPGTIKPSSLQMTVRVDSLEETGAKFTAEQKKIINAEIRKQVLETDEYPEINIKSTEVSGQMTGEGQYRLKIGSDLTLHGVTRHVVIPATVSVKGNQLRAIGEFSVNRSDYKIKATSVKWGTVRVSNKVKFDFDIVADRI